MGRSAGREECRLGWWSAGEGRVQARAECRWGGVSHLVIEVGLVSGVVADGAWRLHRVGVAHGVVLGPAAVVSASKLV